MGIFNLGSSYNRPGPGIPKDAPKKTGAKLFFDILGREFWSLLSLHFIYLLACLPIITIGPATAALCRVTVTMVRDENVYVWRDFWNAFRKNFKQGILFGIPATIFVAVAFYLNFVTVVSVAAGTASIFVIVFVVFWDFLCVSIGCYLFPMVAYIDLKAMPMLKNALLLMVLGKFRTVAAVLVSLACSAAVTLFFPLSIMVVLFFGYFAFLSFFTVFMVWPVIEKYVVLPAGMTQEEKMAELCPRSTSDDDEDDDENDDDLEDEDVD